MSVGSSYAAVKTALQTLLDARSGLDNVSVLSQAPLKPSELAGADGTSDAIWLGDTTGEYSDECFRALPLAFDETYDLTISIQSLKPTSAGSQVAADLRVDQMLYEVLAQIAGDPSIGNSPPGGTPVTGAITPNTFNYLDALPSGFRRIVGFLPTGAGHGSRCELTVTIHCRHVF